MRNKQSVLDTDLKVIPCKGQGSWALWEIGKGIKSASLMMGFGGQSRLLIKEMQVLAMASHLAYAEDEGIWLGH